MQNDPQGIIDSDWKRGLQNAVTILCSNFRMYNSQLQTDDIRRHKKLCRHRLARSKIINKEANSIAVKLKEELEAFTSQSAQSSTKIPAGYQV